MGNEIYKVNTKMYDLPVKMGVIAEVIFTKTKGGWVWLTVPCWEVARLSKPALSVPFISSPHARQWRNSSFPNLSQLRNIRRAENFSGDMKTQAVIAFFKSSLCFQCGTQVLMKFLEPHSICWLDFCTLWESLNST